MPFDKVVDYADAQILALEEKFNGYPVLNKAAKTEKVWS